MHKALPGPQTNHPLPELIERQLANGELDLHLLLGVLQSKRTKTLGAELSGRFDRVRRPIVDLLKQHFGAHPLTSRLVSHLQWKYASTRLVDAIADLDAACTDLAELRLLYRQQRVEELRQRVQQLQFSLDASKNLKGEGVDAGQVKPSALAKKTTIFVIMPFDESFSDVWAGAIQRAARSEGYEAIRVDMINRSSDITDDIIEAIRSCHLAIVDVTGSNANVMFELGYALAKDKPQVIISQSVDFLPFDIRNLRTLVYQNTWSGIEELSNRLAEFLREIPKPKNKHRRARTRPLRHRRHVRVADAIDNGNTN